MNESNKAKHETTSSPNTARDIRVDVFGRTDVGLVREHNEDNFLIADLTAGNRNIRPEVRHHAVGDQGSIFVVCDGMGGAAAGEVASQIAVDTIYDMMQQGIAPETDEALAQRLEKAISEAGRRILTAAKINRAQRGMGTTVTAAALIGPRLLIGQVGDSRAYILRGRQFVQITKDQSLVQQLIDAKQMTEEEARSFDKNNIILQALGTAEEVHVDMTSVVLKSGDRLVICSDGLCGLVDNEAIGQIVYDALNPLEACRVLTENACEAGGYDNITVIVASFDGESLEVPLPDGEIDEALLYDRYSFSRENETTARKVRPSKRETEEEEEEIEPTQADIEIPDSIASMQEKGGARRGLLAAFGIIVALIVGTIVFVLRGSGPEQPIPQQPRLEQSGAPAAAHLPNERPVPAATPTPAPDGAPPPEPTLAPTPEEAITKQVGKRARAVPGRSGAGEDALSTINDEAQKRAKTKAGAEPPAGRSVADDAKARTPGADRPETDTDSRPSERRSVQKKAPPAKNSGETPQKKPIDDNPFGGS